ncbi:hypothetical protein GCK72_021695 [Caenorhabditis remanei]|uniref:Uncharacterized protein n=1 Tax=Caenorhabditis remanei TaxID=31234 RepID=A0A6A5GKJ5_CAERE|nr:hypothetical protein GCK72_021695 [Caenorhabditis remanei]KAF1755126.1 hypothetical protein GCK72_021695 [Caenorhabditis remanei]
MSSNCTDSQHEHFLHRLYGFIEYYRKQISSLIAFIPADSILYTGYNFLCRLFRRLIGPKHTFEIKDLPVPTLTCSNSSVNTKSEISAHTEEELKISEDFKRKMAKRRAELEEKMEVFKAETEKYAEDFERGKRESERQIEELRETYRLEQLEKDKAADMANENLRKRSKKIYNDIMKRGTETDNLNTAKLNEDLISKLDDLEVGSKEENENDALIPRMDSGNKITAELK